MKTLLSVALLSFIVVTHNTFGDCGSLNDNIGLQIIGVYEGTPAGATASQYNPGEVKVNVTGTGPMVLALSAYSATNWIVTKAKEVTITKVLVNGYDAQNVFGVPSATIQKFTYFQNQDSLGVYPYDKGTADAATLISKLEKMTCLKSSSFQGAYTGNAFTVLNSKTAASGISCVVGNWQGKNRDCTGNILAWGSMDNSDLPADASKNCSSAGVQGSCCKFHLYGKGLWFLTDGAPTTTAGLCSDYTSSTCNASGPCGISKFSAIQIYEGPFNHGSTKWDGSTRGAVTVNITGSNPFVLYLSAYEPVSWNLTGKTDLVTRVYIHGYMSGIVTGLPDGIPVTGDAYEKGNASYSLSSWDSTGSSCGTRNESTCYSTTPSTLEQTIAKTYGETATTGNTQGTYSGSSFTISK